MRDHNHQNDILCGSVSLKEEKMSPNAWYRPGVRKTGKGTKQKIKDCSNRLMQPMKGNKAPR